MFQGFKRPAELTLKPTPLTKPPPKKKKKKEKNKKNYTLHPKAKAKNIKFQMTLWVSCFLTPQPQPPLALSLALRR